MKIKTPKTNLGQFLFFFCIQCLSYFLIVANTRAYTQGNYFWTAITDTFFAAQSFVSIKVLVSQEDNKGLWAGLGYTIGGTIGSLFSIWVTKHILGQ